MFRYEYAVWSFGHWPGVQYKSNEMRYTKSSSKFIIGYIWQSNASKECQERQAGSSPTRPQTPLTWGVYSESDRPTVIVLVIVVVVGAWVGLEGGPPAVEQVGVEAGRAAEEVGGAGAREHESVELGGRGVRDARGARWRRGAEQRGCVAASWRRVGRRVRNEAEALSESHARTRTGARARIEAGSGG